MCQGAAGKTLLREAAAPRRVSAALKGRGWGAGCDSPLCCGERTDPFLLLEQEGATLVIIFISAVTEAVSPSAIGGSGDSRTPTAPVPMAQGGCAPAPARYWAGWCHAGVGH